MFKDFIATDQIPIRTDIQIVSPSNFVKQQLYNDQQGLCNGCGTAFRIENLEIDHIVPKAKGGAITTKFTSCFAAIATASKANDQWSTCV